MPGKIAQIYIGKIWLVDGTLGLILCKIMSLIPFLGVTASCLTFTLLSIDRFVAVYFPIKKPITAKVACILIVATWVFSFGFYAVLCHSGTLRTDAHNNTVCMVVATKVFGTSANLIKFIWSEFAIVNIFPLTTSAILYTATMIKLFRRKIPGVGTATNVSYSERVNRRILKMLVTVYLMFFLCWAPSWIWIIVCLQRSASRQLPSFCYSSQYVTFRFMAAYSNSAITPFLYLIFSQNYRQGFKDVMASIVCCVGLKGVLRRGNQVAPDVRSETFRTAFQRRSRGQSKVDQTVI